MSMVLTGFTIDGRPHGVLRDIWLVESLVLVRCGARDNVSKIASLVGL